MGYYVHKLEASAAGGTVARSDNDTALCAGVCADVAIRQGQVVLQEPEGRVADGVARHFGRFALFPAGEHRAGIYSGIECGDYHCRNAASHDADGKSA